MIQVGANLRKNNIREALHRNNYSGMGYSFSLLKLKTVPRYKRLWHVAGTCKKGFLILNLW